MGGENASRPCAAERIQLQLNLPYKLEPREHPELRRLLAEGYRVAQFQRLSDQEVLVTLARAASGPA